MPGKHEKTIRFHGRFSAAAIFTGAAPNKPACDLGKAYPAEAGVKNFLRTLDFSPASVVVEDKIELSKRKDLQIKLLSVAKPEKFGKNSIKIGNVVMRLDGIDFAEMHVLSKMNESWNRVIYEIFLKGEHDNYKMIFDETE